MRAAWLILLALLTGCVGVDDARQVTEGDLKFHVGDSVVIVQGVYRGCAGYISGVRPYVFQSNGYRAIYELSDVTCQGRSIGGLSNAAEAHLALAPKEGQ